MAKSRIIPRRFYWQQMICASGQPTHNPNFTKILKRKGSLFIILQRLLLWLYFAFIKGDEDRFYRRLILLSQDFVALGPPRHSRRLSKTQVSTSKKCEKGLLRWPLSSSPFLRKYMYVVFSQNKGIYI